MQGGAECKTSLGTEAGVNAIDIRVTSFIISCMCTKI